MEIPGEYAFCQFTPSFVDDIYCNWLPPYHDMGLIGGVLTSAACLIHSVMMSPVAFVQNPILWLKAISKYRATVSGAPNFAYELCASKVTSADLKELDLSYVC